MGVDCMKDAGRSVQEGLDPRPPPSDVVPMDETEVESEETKVEIPIDELSPEALLGVVDDYVLREGTDYGRGEVPLEAKREQVLSQLRSGKAIVIFDPVTETCTIASRER